MLIWKNKKKLCNDRREMRYLPIEKMHFNMEINNWGIHKILWGVSYFLLLHCFLSSFPASFFTSNPTYLYLLLQSSAFPSYLPLATRPSS